MQQHQPPQFQAPASPNQHQQYQAPQQQGVYGAGQGQEKLECEQEYLMVGLISLILLIPGIHNAYLAVNAKNKSMVMGLWLKAGIQIIFGSFWMYFLVHIFLHMIVSVIVELFVWGLLWWTFVIPSLVSSIDGLLWGVTGFIWIVMIPIYIWVIFELITAHDIVGNAMLAGGARPQQPSVVVHSTGPPAQPQAYYPQQQANYPQQQATYPQQQANNHSPPTGPPPAQSQPQAFQPQQQTYTQQKPGQNGDFGEEPDYN